MSTLNAQWTHGTDNSMWLCLESRSPQRLPMSLANLLRHADAPSLSGDAIADLLRGEAWLRARATTAHAALAAAENHLHNTRGTTPSSTRRHWLPRPSLGRALRQAITAHARAASDARHALADLAHLRDFVIALDQPRTGPLFAAAEGWQRPPGPPSTVEVCGLNEFLFRQPRRATIGERGTQVTDGVEQWGRAWRHDLDDNTLTDYDNAGQWTVGYIPNTREIYALCRNPQQTVWLLGAGLPWTRANDLLWTLAHDMRQPNSLILAADAVRVATSYPIGDPPVCNGHRAQRVTAHARDKKPAEQANHHERASLRMAVDALQEHLRDHRDLAGQSLDLGHFADSPAPLPTGAHQLPWRGYDIDITCTVADLVAWYWSAPLSRTLTLGRTEQDGPVQVTLVVRMYRGQFTIRADAPELSEMSPVIVGQQKVLKIEHLTRLMLAAATVAAHDERTFQPPTAAAVATRNT